MKPKAHFFVSFDRKETEGGINRPIEADRLAFPESNRTMERRPAEVPREDEAIFRKRGCVHFRTSDDRFFGVMENIQVVRKPGRVRFLIHHHATSQVTVGAAKFREQPKHLPLKRS